VDGRLEEVMKPCVVPGGLGREISVERTDMTLPVYVLEVETVKDVTL
jgi:hypothetical protein